MYGACNRASSGLTRVRYFLCNRNQENLICVASAADPPRNDQIHGQGSADVRPNWGVLKRSCPGAWSCQRRDVCRHVPSFVRSRTQATPSIAPNKSTNLVRRPTTPARNGNAASELPKNNQAMKPLLTLAVFVTSLMLSPFTFAASFKVRAQIDAHSQLVVRRDSPYWHHLIYVRPGLHDCRCPTLINGYPWTPIWLKEIAELDLTDPPVDSKPLDISASFSASGVAIAEVLGRGRVAVAQQPTAANDFTLIVDFDDIKEGGAAFYDLTLSAVSITALPRPTFRHAPKAGV